MIQNNQHNEFIKQIGKILSNNPNHLDDNFNNLKKQFPEYSQLICEINFVFLQENSFKNLLNTVSSIEEIILTIGICFSAFNNFDRMKQLLKNSISYLSKEEQKNLYLLFSTKYIKNYPNFLPELIIFIFEIYPTEPIFYFHFAQHFKSEKKYQEAIEYYQKAIQLKPDYLEAIFYLANLYKQINQPILAIKFYKAAIQINPNIPEPYFNMGNILSDIGKIDPAIHCYQLAIKISPTFVITYLNLGLLYEKLDRYENAIECFQKLISVNPKFEEGYNALGLLYSKLGKLEESENIFNQAIQLNPTLPKFHGNIANLLQKKSEYSKSLIHYNKAIELEPKYYEAIFSRSLIYLLTGNFEKGWQDYEQRWNLPTFNMRKYSKPLWNGQKLKNKTLLVWAEQGFGDTIHFCRYLNLLKKQNVRIIFECQPQLIDLLQILSSYDEIRPKKSVSDNEFDYHVPLLSLPSLFKTNLTSIPGSSPYLQVPDSYQQKLHDKLQFNKNITNIGIVWSGNIKNKNDINRSCHPKYFSAIEKREDVKLYSLLLKKENEIIHIPEFNFIQDLSSHINNFADTAAIIEKLDVIISVDTAVAHLAGALAKKVFLIIPYQPEWRWMLDRTDSPWYPTMKIFRQKIFGDWQQVLDDVLEELHSHN